ncbi:lipid II:glycine glycyltransferase FemX [Pajaroellobacter abortibovis]|uniref:BioF2-like acetyltransferase domain-containing protein n=1 Tax=Pajaroellobacter abortibovis TaxID=1882918 RepID=A0A1L6MX88_9BACT|nr:peptidoglycan bridge formation glycyltransferase FemA/FemB family protein [Pajaroellobacter abortibovis]APS00112.1 hypothetical protein BCY86_05015 [Pajaroellobacter abortibovis]
MKIIFKKSLSQEEEIAYDRFVATARHAHYTQSRTWIRMATCYGFTSVYHFMVYQERGVIGAGLVLRRCIGGIPLPMAWIHRGPVVEDWGHFKTVLDALIATTQRHGVMHLSLMPYGFGEDVEKVEETLRSFRFSHRFTYDGSYVRTLHVPISAIQSDDDMLMRMNKKARVVVQQARRMGITVRQGDPSDVQHLDAFYCSMMGLQGKQSRAKAWFQALYHVMALRSSTALFVAEEKRELVSVIVVVQHNTTSTFIRGASTPLSKPYTKMALPLFHAMCWARDRGCTTFDLGGVPLAEDPDSKRRQIAFFKRQFSNRETPLVREHVRWF